MAADAQFPMEASVVFDDVVNEHEGCGLEHQLVHGRTDAAANGRRLDFFDAREFVEPRSEEQGLVGTFWYAQCVAGSAADEFVDFHIDDPATGV